MILKPSAPPAEAEEEDFAVAQPVFQAGGGAARAAAAAVAPAYLLAAGNVPLAPNVDEPPENMTDKYFTMEIMTDPVMAFDGFTYERASIEAWFAMGKTTSPYTGQELTGIMLIPNHDLRSQILEWQAGRVRKGAH